MCTKNTTGDYGDGKHEFMGENSECTILKQNQTPQIQLKAQTLSQAAIKDMESKFTGNKRPVSNHYLSPSKLSPSVLLSIPHRPHLPLDRRGREKKGERNE
jgi:hypothetical protein